MKDRKKLIIRILAVLLALGVWQLAAMLVKMNILLVSPIRVAVRLFELILEPEFFPTVLYSLGRISAGFLLAFFSGTLLALAAGRFPVLEALLRPYVVVMKTVPVASFIIISLIWLSSSRLTVFISFLMVFPILYSNVLQGMKSTDGNLLEMAKIFRIPFGKRLLYVYLPQLKPYLLSACSVALGISWKSGVAAEVIGVVKGSLGEALYESKIYFMTADLFAWTVVIVLVSVVFEKLFLLLLKVLFAGLERL